MDIDPSPPITEPMSVPPGPQTVVVSSNPGGVDETPTPLGSGDTSQTLHEGQHLTTNQEVGVRHREAANTQLPSNVQTNNGTPGDPLQAQHQPSGRPLHILSSVPASRRRKASDLGDDELPRKTHIVSSGSRDKITELEANLRAKDTQIKFFADRSMQQLTELTRTDEELKRCQGAMVDLTDERDRAIQMMNAALDTQQSAKIKYDRLMRKFTEMAVKLADPDQQRIGAAPSKSQLEETTQQLKALQGSNAEQAKTIITLREESLALQFSKDTEIRTAVGQLEMMKRQLAQLSEDSEEELNRLTVERHEDGEKMVAWESKVSTLEKEIEHLQAVQGQSLSAELELFRESVSTRKGVTLSLKDALEVAERNDLALASLQQIHDGCHDLLLSHQEKVTLKDKELDSLALAHASHLHHQDEAHTKAICDIKTEHEKDTIKAAEKIAALESELRTVQGQSLSAELELFRERVSTRKDVTLSLKDALEVAERNDLALASLQQIHDSCHDLLLSHQEKVTLKDKELDSLALAHASHLHHQDEAHTKAICDIKTEHEKDTIKAAEKIAALESELNTSLTNGAAQKSLVDDESAKAVRATQCLNAERAKLAALQAQLTSAVASVNQLEDKLIIGTEKLEASVTHCQELDEKLQHNSELLQSANTYAESLVKDVNRLQEKLDSQPNHLRLAQLETDLNQHKAIIVTLQNQLSGCDADAVEDREQRLTLLEDEVGTLKISARTLQSKLTTTQDQLRDALSAESTLRTSLVYKTNENTAKAKEQIVLTKEKNLLSNKLAAAEKCTAELQERLAHCQKDIESLQAKILLDAQSRSDQDVNMGCSLHETIIAQLRSKLDSANAHAQRDGYTGSPDQESPPDNDDAPSSTPRDKGKGRAMDNNSPAGPSSGMDNNSPAGPSSGGGFSFRQGTSRPNDPAPFQPSSGSHPPPPPPPRNPSLSRQGPAVPFIPSTHNIQLLVDDRLGEMEERLARQIHVAIRKGLEPSSSARKVKRTKRKTNSQDDDDDDDDDDDADNEVQIANKLTLAQQKLVRTAVYRFFGIKKHAKEAHTLPFVPQAELEAYRLPPDEQTGDLPALSVPHRPDWGEKWGNYNQHLGKVFIARWKEDVGAVDEEQSGIPDTLALRHFQQIIGTLIKNRRTKLSGTPSEVNVRETRQKKINRSNSRRNTLYQCRLWAVNHYIGTAETDADRTLFMYMKDTIETLSTDGVSSDESDAEDITGNTFKVHKCTWKSSIVTDIEDFLDRSIYAKVGMENGKGRKLRIRKRVDNPNSRRTVPDNLPSNFYSATFLQRHATSQAEPFPTKAAVAPMFWTIEENTLKARLLE